MHAEALKIYALKLDKDGHIIGEVADDAGTEIVNLAREFIDDHPGTSFGEAVRRVREKRPDLARQYAGLPVPTRQPANTNTGDPCATIHAAASKLIEGDPKLDYADAVARVLKADRTLAGQYAAFVSNGRRQ